MARNTVSRFDGLRFGCAAVAAESSLQFHVRLVVASGRVDIFCDDRFDPSAEAISCLALLNPFFLSQKPSSERTVETYGLCGKQGYIAELAN